MQTWVAWAGDPRSPGGTENDIRDALRKVDAHEQGVRSRPTRRESLAARSCGLVYWEQADPRPFTWPAWVRRGGRVVCTLYLPLGHEKVTGATDLERAAIELADRCVAAPQAMSVITPPFVLARLDRDADSLHVLTDHLGSGRVFEVRTPGGWVWSNRPLTAALFAGTVVIPDPRGWAHSAVADEFFGGATPFDGVRAIGPAAHVEWNGRIGRRTVTMVDTAATLMAVAPAPSGGAPDQVDDGLADEVAADLVASVRSIGRFHDGTPTVDLTGGRDSRVVAAAFVAADVPFRLHTHDRVPGDLAVARELVSRLPTPPDHMVAHVRARPRAERAPLRVLPNVLRWHAYAEALRPCSYLPSPAPSTIDNDLRLVVGGVGGETAHGYYYPGDLTRLLDLPPSTRMLTFAQRVVARHSPVPGPSADALATVTDHVEGVLLRIHDLGVRGGTVLDHYYVLERMRRWGTTAERLGTVSPLLALSFQRGGLALGPDQRRAHALHRAVTRRLVPQWADVAYFPAEYPPEAARTTSPAPPPRLFRLADADDADEVEAMLADAGAWAESFDHAAIASYWEASVSGESTPAQERVLRSAVWRGAFGDWLTERAGHDVPHRTGRLPTSVGAKIVLPTPTIPNLRRSRFVRRAVRTRGWLLVRDTPPVRALRGRTRTGG